MLKTFMHGLGVGVGIAIVAVCVIAADKPGDDAPAVYENFPDRVGIRNPKDHTSGGFWAAGGDSGPMFSMSHKDGKITMAVDQNGVPYLRMEHDKKNMCFLTCYEGIPTLVLYNKDGKPNTIATGDSRAGLTVFDKEGNLFWRTPQKQ